MKYDLRKESSCASSPGLELAEILKQGLDEVLILAYEHDIPEKLAKVLGEKYGYSVDYSKKEDHVEIVFVRGR